MQKLKRPVSLETTFGTYVVDEILGEGGAGVVYGGIEADGTPVAVKVLSPDRATSDKRKRFKNEIAFLARNKHSNIVTVTDHGLAQGEQIKGPFYVMRRYQKNLRQLMREKISPPNILSLFGQIFDGVEAAHLQGVVHRDLKPENILCDNNGQNLAVADFGVASFTDDLLVTLVETSPTQRLANFQYAAPEQREVGKIIATSADMYALGLMLNETFTGAVPHGTDYQSIASVSKEHAFLDGIVAKLLKQTAAERPRSIADLKGLIQQYQAEFASQQRLSAINQTVIRVGDIDEPLAHEPPKIISADWNVGTLTLTLDRPVNHQWISALLDMGSHASAMGVEPQNFSFGGDKARARVSDGDVQRVIDYFKDWLPKASRKLKQTLEDEARQKEAHRREQLRLQKLAEEKRLEVLRNIKL